MNVVFISPHFPLYFHNFCSRLKERGVNVLGIGDEDYNLISNEAKNAVTEYYKVSNLENFEEVENACKFYENKYGKIDWIESQNEYWLEVEATLRSKFNVNTGTKIENMSPMKYKSKMKDVYKKANIDRRLFSKIRNNKDYTPSKPTVLSLAIALELNLDKTNDLLRKAGFALSHSNKFDIIIEYFISNQIYDIYKINETLFSFDQNILRT